MIDRAGLNHGVPTDESDDMSGQAILNVWMESTVEHLERCCAATTPAWSPGPHQ